MTQDYPWVSQIILQSRIIETLFVTVFLCIKHDSGTNIVQWKTCIITNLVLLFESVSGYYIILC